MFTRDGLSITGREHSTDLHSEELQWKLTGTGKLQKTGSMSVTQSFWFVAWIQVRKESLSDNMQWINWGSVWCEAKRELLEHLVEHLAQRPRDFCWHLSLLITEQPIRESSFWSCDHTSVCSLLNCWNILVSGCPSAEIKDTLKDDLPGFSLLFHYHSRRRCSCLFLLSFLKNYLKFNTDSHRNHLIIRSIFKFQLSFCNLFFFCNKKLDTSLPRKMFLLNILNFWRSSYQKGNENTFPI